MSDSKTYTSDDWMDVFETLEVLDEVVIEDYSQPHVVTDTSERDADIQRVQVESPRGKERVIWGRESRDSSHAGALRNNRYGYVCDVNYLEVLGDDDE